MAKVTPGFGLYLYQLLSCELGFGKQTLLPQVEEVLAADDIIPQDLECATMQELVEACPDFLKLTIFKKGRAYATVLRNEEWDAMLAAPQEKAPAKQGKAAGGPKSWKKKKGGKKTFKAVKPGKQRREREAAEAAAHALAAERAAQEAAAAEQRAAEEAAATASGESLTAQTSVAGETTLPQAGEVVSDARAQDTQKVAGAGVPPQGAAGNTARGRQANEAAPSSDGEPAPSTNGPVARTLADILAEARAAEELMREEAQPEDSGIEQGAAAAQEPAPAIEQEAPCTPEAPANPDAAPAQIPAPSDTPAAPAPTQAPGTPTAPAPTQASDTPAAPEAAQVPGTPAAPTPAPISLTITYNPYEDMELELERQRQEELLAQPKAEPVELPRRPRGEQPFSSPAPAVLSGLPSTISQDVSCKDALLRVLYQLLPYEVEPMAVLDEDWRVARSTGSVSGSRNRVSFPLRYQHEDGSPLTVTLRKTTRNASGRQWSLALVDGDDGTGSSHDTVGFEGLPQMDEGAWADLSGTTSGQLPNPVRELAQQILIGTWDGFLGALAATAAPERWNYPGEGVGRASRYGILREYLACTFHRARCQERVAQAADGSFAAFDTGLLTTFGDDIYACLTANKGDIPWKFAGFATAGSGELGARLTGTISPLPQPPSYLSTLESVMPDAQRMVILDLEGILTGQLGRLPRAFLRERLEGNAQAMAILQKESLATADLTQLARAIKADAGAYRRLRRAFDDAIEQAMRATRASYRLAAPVYDPTENRTKLLLPLCLVEEGTADCALVLDLQPSGAYRAAALLSLQRAYACARVISREQPGWLTASRVL